MRTAESCPVAAPRQDTDPDRWPDVMTPPDTSRARTAVTRALLRRALERLPLQARFADGTRVGAGGPVIEIHDPAAFHRRIGAQGLIGFGESYMAGEWDAPDLVAALTVLAGNAAQIVPAPLQKLRGLWAMSRPDVQRNTPTGARDNISRHYDLSNDLFALFLDDTLSYSAASRGIFHWSHPEYCMCWTYTKTCSIGNTSLWIEDKCLTSLPSFNWFYS